MVKDEFRLSVVRALWRIAIFIAYYLLLLTVGILTVVTVYQWTMAFMNE